MTGRAGGRFAYERAIRRSTLAAPARHLALTIATWANLETGLIPERFQPSLSTLAEATGMSTATVKRHLNVLEAKGWIGRERPEGDTARTEHARTAYSLKIPAQAWLTLSQDADDSGLTLSQERDHARLRLSQGLGSLAAKAGLTASHKSALSSVEVPLSQAVPEDSAAETPRRKRENEAAPSKIEPRTDEPDGTPSAAQRVVRASGAVPLDQESAFIAWVTAKHQVRSPGFWRTVAADIPELAAAWRADGAATVRPAWHGIPPWCGNCGDSNPAAEFNPRFRYLGEDGEPDRERCPDCHPDRAARDNDSATVRKDYVAPVGIRWHELPRSIP